MQEVDDDLILLNLISPNGVCAAGPSVLEVFNNLLRHLRISIDRKSTDVKQRNEEIKFEEAVVNTIGEYLHNACFILLSDS